MTGQHVSQQKRRHWDRQSLRKGFSLEPEKYGKKENHIPDTEKKVEGDYDLSALNLKPEKKEETK